MSKKYPIVSADPAVQSHYVACRKKGTSHNLAVIFATGKTPGSVSDREWFAGHRYLRDQFGPNEDKVLEKMVRIAEANGRKPMATDRYEPSLARYCGDPEAFVPASEGRHHVEKVLKKRGWASDGLVKVSAPRYMTHDELESRMEGEKHDVSRVTSTPGDGSVPTKRMQSRRGLRLQGQRRNGLQLPASAT